MKLPIHDRAATPTTTIAAATATTTTTTITTAAATPAATPASTPAITHSFTLAEYRGVVSAEIDMCMRAMALLLLLLLHTLCR